MNAAHPPASPPAPARRLLLVVVGLSAVLALAIGLSVSFGAAAVPLWQRLLLGGVWSEAQQAILFALRLPRVLTAAALGGLLGVAGVAFQALLRNPLAAAVNLDVIDIGLDQHFAMTIRYRHRVIVVAVTHQRE